jgi:hypothetical protein
MNKNIDFVILVALFDADRERGLSELALKMAVQKVIADATQEQINAGLLRLITNHQVDLIKRGTVHEAFALTSAGRDELLKLDDGTVELHRRAHVHNLENNMDKNVALVQEPTSENNGRVLNSMTVGKLPEGQAEVWLHDLAKAQGDDEIRMRDAFGIALVMTDYVKFVAMSGGFMDRQDIPGKLKKMVFVDEAGEFIQPGKTITVHERNFQAHLWVKVISPGVNQVCTHVEDRDDDRFSLSYNFEDGNGAGSFWEKVKGDWKPMAVFFGLPWDAEKQAYKIPLAPIPQYISNADDSKAISVKVVE